jgi:putative ABC transport system substrate-binding protein
MVMRANIRRRHFLKCGLVLAGLGLASGCGVRLPWQAPPKVARIGLLEFNTPGMNGEAGPAFLGGLRDLGWVENENLSIDIRYGDSTYERLEALAAELVALKLDLIFSSTATGVQTLKKATNTIPIVFGGIGDPVSGGIIESFAHPGGNATGTTSLVEGLTAKHVELLKDCVPTMSRVAALRHPAVTGPQWRDVQGAAARLGLSFRALEAPDVAGIEAGFASLKDDPVDGLVVMSGATLFVERVRIVGLAAQHRVPAVYPFLEYADAGGLLAYAANGPELSRRAATYADKILKGANPAELPVERPTKIDFVVNVKTAQGLGLTVPKSVLGQATRIIE